MRKAWENNRCGYLEPQSKDPGVTGHPKSERANQYVEVQTKG